MPTYLRDDPVRDGVQLYRWDPVEPMRTLTPTVRDAADAADPGHLRVPQLIEGGSVVSSGGPVCPRMMPR